MTSITYAVTLSESATMQITHQLDGTIAEGSWTGTSWTATVTLTPSADGKSRAYFGVVIVAPINVILTGEMTITEGGASVAGEAINTAPEGSYIPADGDIPAYTEMGGVWQTDYLIYCLY